MRALIDLGPYVVGIDKADKAALSFFEDEGVGVVLHARARVKESHKVVGRLWLQFDDLSMFADEDDEDMADKTSVACWSDVHVLKKRHAKMNDAFVGRIRYVSVDDGHARKGIGGRALRRRGDGGVQAGARGDRGGRMLPRRADLELRAAGLDRQPAASEPLRRRGVRGFAPNDVGSEPR